MEFRLRRRREIFVQGNADGRRRTCCTSSPDNAALREKIRRCNCFGFLLFSLQAGDTGQLQTFEELE